MISLDINISGLSLNQLVIISRNLYIRDHPYIMSSLRLIEYRGIYLTNSELGRFKKIRIFLNFHLLTLEIYKILMELKYLKHQHLDTVTIR